MLMSVSRIGESAVWLEPTPVPPVLPLRVLRRTQGQAGAALRAPGRDGERDRVRCDPSDAPVAQGVPGLEDVSDAVRRLAEGRQTARTADDTRQLDRADRESRVVLAKEDGRERIAPALGLVRDRP